MPLGTREVLVAIRAKDEASRIIRNVSSAFKQAGTDMDDTAKQAQVAGQRSMQMGGALMGVGAGIALAGAAGLAFYKNMAQAAIDYNKEASLTLTQVRETGVGLEDIKDIGKRVAGEIAAPFEQIQTALYDIFSSTDLNAKDAEAALRSFSKAAVAGNTDIVKASDAGISILNGFRLPITDLDHVMDAQFKTVQIGRITYEQLASTIGRAIPSAQKAGATVDDLGGMLAFMTRNGMSAAMAATSSARAFDLMSNPVFEANMKAIGLSTRDAAGNFKPMVDVVDELKTKMKGMNEGQKADFLKNITFGAGGTIQAMRFLNEATNDTDGALRSYTDQVKNSAGQMDAAYKIMADTPAAKLQLLKNNWKILKTTIGDEVIPIISNLVSALMPVVQWFNNLDPTLKRNIILGGLIASALMVLVGVGIAVAGAIMLIGGAAEVLGIGFGTLIAISGGVLLAIIAVAAAGYLIYKNWDQVRAFIMGIWDAMKKAWAAFIDGFQTGDTAKSLGQSGLIGTFINLGVAARDVFNALKAGFKDVVAGGQILWTGLQLVFGYLVGFWNTILFPLLDALSARFRSTFDILGAVVSAVWTLIQPIIQMMVDFFNTILLPIFTAIGIAVTTYFGMVGAVISTVWGFIQPFLQAWWEVMKVLIDIVTFLAAVFGVAFNVIMVVIQVFWAIFSVIIQMIVGILVVLLTPVVQAFADMFSAAFHNVADVVSWAWNNMIKPVLSALAGFFKDYIAPVIDALKKKWTEFWNAAGPVVSDAWNAIKGGLKDGINGAIDLLNGFLRASVGIVNNLISLYNKIPGAPNVDKIDVPQVPRLHSGGIVTNELPIGAAGEVLRVLQSGEGVLSRDTMGRIGSDGLDALKSGATMPAQVTAGQSVVIGAGAIQINVDGGSGDVAAQVEQGVLGALRQLSNQVKVAS